MKSKRLLTLNLSSFFNFALFLFIFIFSFVFLSTNAFSINLLAFDHGCGGLFWGLNSSFINILPNSSIDFMYFGAYGYGVYRHSIIGGFGFAILSTEPNNAFASDLAGGFGGIVSGYNIFDNYISSLNLLFWLGLGGMGLSSLEGYFAGYFEVDIELGLKINRFTELVFYGGYQIIGSLIPGRPFYSYFHGTIVFGFRLGFGA